MITSKLRAAVIVSVLLASWLSACASLARQKAECTWLEIANEEGLEASGTRSLVLGHQGPANCGTVSNYQLRRPGYTIELWNGYDTEPSLYLRASSSEGDSLDLVSADLVSVRRGGESAHGRNGMTYRHYFDWKRLATSGPAPVFPYTLLVTVVDASGKTLSTESFTLVKKVGHYYFSDW